MKAAKLAEEEKDVVENLRIFDHKRRINQIGVVIAPCCGRPAEEV